MGRKRRVDVVPGMKFKMLTATDVPQRIEQKGNHLFCNFLCTCGTSKSIRVSHVVAGFIKSCGCLRTNGIGDGESSFNSLCYEYEYHAKNRGIDFGLSREEVKQLTKSNCAYCGVAPERMHTRTWKKGSKSSPYICNGIDRVDNNKGYTLSNCVACCKVCNIAKRSMSLDEFLVWIDRLVKFNTNLKVMPSASEQD
jgi:hypothetical protein